MTPFAGRFYGRKTRRVQGRTHDQPQKRNLSSECAQRRRMQDRVLPGPFALRSSGRPWHWYAGARFRRGVMRGGSRPATALS